ncbi:MAG TPA: uracil-DNA glycosylase [Bacillus sp. (in: firmicutes)]|uniref:uracil-DNA glycosylase n=1 Tax=Bacillus litorisediminis TaxID=2922713 RepID=UPI001FAB9609|nr:uracil-DNA glycosylase [Bacillus litorisediminis]HWO77011.1 uracil-DNA glycosylase [Bacillus sp. (in: firmicutes)]
MLIPNLNNHWDVLLKEEWEKTYYQRLAATIKKEYENFTIYPKQEDLFNAFRLTDYPDVKAVILGQDPYHGPNQAHGLSFSVKRGERIPPSLRNIYKELKADLGFDSPNHGCLEKWAKEGVLLLNTILTVRDGKALSHRGLGWEMFTDHVISLLNDRDKPVIFILWGKPAQSKLTLIDQEKNPCILAPHPSPLSANKGFFGSRPFSKVNHILKQWNEKEIDWRVPDR